MKSAEPSSSTLNDDRLLSPGASSMSPVQALKQAPCQGLFVVSSQRKMACEARSLLTKRCDRRQ